MTSPYYRPSGRVPASALPIIVVYALATLPAAWVYAWLMIHLPPVINLFFTMCFSIWLGFMVQQAGARAKVRNPEWLARFGFTIGLAGWYFHWAAWVAMTARMHADRPEAFPLIGSFVGMVLHPSALVDAAIDIAHVGTWSLRGERINGFMLVMFWLGELGILLCLIRHFGRMQGEKPFCEASNAWAEKVDVPRKFAFIDEPHAALSFVEHHPHDVISVLAPWSESVSLSYAKVTIYRCRGADSYLSISNITAAMGKEKIKESETPIVEHLRLPGIDPDDLMRQLMEAIPRPVEVESKTGEVPVPKELETAVDDLNAGRFEAAFAAAVPYVKSDPASLRTDANRLCGLATSRLARWDEAFGFWYALFDDEPTAHNALQTATSSVMAGDLARGITWVERARTINATSCEVPGMTIETNFVTALTQAGQMQAAMPYLEDIRKFYVEFGITDPTVLYMNRFPPFHVFLNNSAPIVRANLDGEQERHWYSSMLPHLDERGKVELNEWMREQLQMG
jgi:hypothetical protein